MNMTPEEERHALIDRYVNRKLTAEEEAEFEIRMMDDSELFEEMQLVEALRKGLIQHADLLQETIAPSTTQHQIAQTAAVTGARVLPFRLWLQQPISWAASFVIAALGLQAILAGYTPLFNDREGTDDGALPIHTLLLLETTRGIAPLQFIGPPPYLIQIDAGYGNENGSFDLTLTHVATAEVIISQGKLRADTDGWIRLVTSAALTGEYLVALEWEDISGTSQRREYQLSITN